MVKVTIVCGRCVDAGRRGAVTWFSFANPAPAAPQAGSQFARDVFDSLRSPQGLIVDVDAEGNAFERPQTDDEKLRLGGPALAGADGEIVHETGDRPPGWMCRRCSRALPPLTVDTMRFLARELLAGRTRVFEPEGRLAPGVPQRRDLLLPLPTWWRAGSPSR